MTTTQFEWFYDVAVAALLLIFLYVGGKRGFIRSVLMLVGYIVSFAAASFVSSVATPILYEKFAQDKIVSIIEGNIENINIMNELKSVLGLDKLGITVQDEEINSLLSSNSGDLSGDIQQFISEKTGGMEISKEEIDGKLQTVVNSSFVSRFISNLPGNMAEALNEYTEKSSQTLSESLKVLTSTKADAAKYIETNIVRNSLMPIIKTLIFILVFTFTLIIVKMITRLFSGFNRIPIAGSINAFLGALLGLAQGLAVVLLIALVVHVLVVLTSDELIVINTQTIQNTYLFKLFYNFKLLK